MLFLRPSFIKSTARPLVLERRVWELERAQRKKLALPCPTPPCKKYSCTAINSYPLPPNGIPDCRQVYTCVSVYVCFCADYVEDRTGAGST